MNIAMIGYGKMGKVIESLGIDQGHQVIPVSKNDSFEKVKSADVAIEFTNPESAAKNINSCFDLGIPVVVGTTGWYDHFEAITENCQEKNGTLFYATNFSLGVNIFFEINKKLASLMSNQAYDVKLEETHHTEKKDTPSGTAITLAEGIIDNSLKEQWKLGKTTNRKELEIQAYRIDDVKGRHAITYNSSIDTISIMHDAKNRNGFAMGAIQAAEFIKDKKGVFTMKDLLNF